MTAIAVGFALLYFGIVRRAIDPAFPYWSLHYYEWWWSPPTAAAGFAAWDSLARPLYLLAVLIRAGEEERVSAQKTLPPCDCVAGDRGVSMADVRPRVHIVNRGRDVELSGHADVIFVIGLCAKM